MAVKFWKGEKQKEEKESIWKEEEGSKAIPTLSTNWEHDISNQSTASTNMDATAGVDPAEDSPETGDTNTQYHINPHNEYQVDN